VAGSFRAYHLFFRDAVIKCISRGHSALNSCTLFGADGKPRDFRVVSGLTARLKAARIDGVQQRRYDPATCEGTLVEVETCGRQLSLL
jgi:hypothetical protein